MPLCRRAFALGCSIALMAAPAVRAEPGTGVAVMALPSRLHHARLNQWVGRLTTLAAGAGTVQALAMNGAEELSAQLTKAKILALQGRLDPAAQQYDSAIAQGTRAPQIVVDSDAWIGALIRRAAIALARRESAEPLLERVLRSDPTVVLQEGEDSPPVMMALEKVRAQLGAPPPLTADFIGETCQKVPVLYVVRALANEEVEVSRFERCQLGQQVTASAANAEVTLHALFPTRPVAPPAPPPPSRAPFGLGVGLGIAAVASLAIGTGLYVAARNNAGELAAECAGGNCPGLDPALASSGRALEQTAYALFSFGAIFAVGDAVAWTLFVRQKRAQR